MEAYTTKINNTIQNWKILAINIQKVASNIFSFGNFNVCNEINLLKASSKKKLAIKKDTKKNATILVIRVLILKPCQELGRTMLLQVNLFGKLR